MRFPHEENLSNTLLQCLYTGLRAYEVYEGAHEFTFDQNVKNVFQRFEAVFDRTRMETSFRDDHLYRAELIGPTPRLELTSIEVERCVNLRSNEGGKVLTFHEFHALFNNFPEDLSIDLKFNYQRQTPETPMMGARAVVVAPNAPLASRAPRAHAASRRRSLTFESSSSLFQVLSYIGNLKMTDRAKVSVMKQFVREALTDKEIGRYEFAACASFILKKWGDKCKETEFVHMLTQLKPETIRHILYSLHISCADDDTIFDLAKLVKNDQQNNPHAHEVIFDNFTDLLDGLE